MPLHDTSRLKVLLVEDEPMLLELYSIMLEESDFVVGTAHCAMMGLRRIREESWDVVVTDRAMLEMSGEEMAAAIKSLAPEIPLILITGLPTAVERAELFVAVLPKPFLKEHLVRAVTAAYRTRQDAVAVNG